MTIDNNVLQNITIAIVIVVMALVVALLLSFVIMRRIVSHNTSLVEAMTKRKNKPRKNARNLPMQMPCLSRSMN